MANRQIKMQRNF